MKSSIKVYVQLLVNEEKPYVGFKEMTYELNEQGKVDALDACSSEGIDDDNHLIFVGSDSHLYRLHYDKLNKPVIAKATVRNDAISWIHWNEGRFSSQVSTPLKDKDVYQAMLSSLTSWRCRANLESCILSSLEKIKEREADAVRRERLITVDVEARAEEDFVRFNQRLLQAYQKKVYQAILALVTAHDNNLSQALADYLKQQWLLVKGTKLSYTAMPTHPVTEVLIQIAEALAKEDESKAAIEFLMPGVRPESDTPLYPNLRDIPLRQVLKTHILNHTHHYLLPVSLCAAKTRHLHEYDGYANPYYDGLDDKDESNMVITADEWVRLWHHSGLTHRLRESKDRYDLIARNKDTLLGQLHLLCKSFSLYGSYGGLGTGENASGGVYLVLLRFFEYYGLVDEKLVPEPIKRALAQVQVQLIDHTSEERDGVKTCITYHRVALLSLIQTHQAALNDITLSGNKKETEFQKAQFLLEAHRQELQAALLQPDYEGVDAFGVTVELLTALDVSLRLDTEEDLTLFRFFSPQEMRQLLADNETLREDVLRQLPSLESFVWFLHSLPAAHIQVLCESLGEALSSRLLVTNPHESVSALFLSLSPEKITAICVGLKALPLLINNATDFFYVLKYLSPEQRTAVYEATKAQLPLLINNATDFFYVLKYLSPEQRTAVYEATKAQLPLLINNATDFFYVLKYLSPEQRIEVFNAIQKNIVSPKRGSFYSILYKFLKRFTEAQWMKFCNAMKNRPISLYEFCFVLMCLEDQKSEILEAAMNTDFSLINSNFQCILPILLSDVMKAELPSLILTSQDFVDLSKYIQKYFTANEVYVCYQHMRSAGLPILHWLVPLEEGWALMRFLDPMEIQDKLRALREKDRNGKTVLQLAAVDYPQSAESIFSCLPKDGSTSLEHFQIEVQNAADNYIEWSESNPSKKKSAIGQIRFFTPIANDATGVTRAKNLQSTVWRAETLEEAQEAVKTFLNAYFRFGLRYKPYSCASFLINKLIKVDKSTWESYEPLISKCWSNPCFLYEFR